MNIAREKLSYEKFAELANRMPNLNGDWIYLLEQTEFEEDESNHYPQFELGFTKRIFFRTFADAEKYLRENCDNKPLLYRSVITQIPIGQEDYRQGAQWLYNASGELIDFSTTTQTGSTYDTVFFGRADNRQRFRKGDIVEVCDGQNVRLALLVSPPPSIDRCWNIYLKYTNDECPGAYPLDWSDDSCLVVDGPDSFLNHSHPSPLQLMAPRFPIPAELMVEMKSWLK